MLRAYGELKLERRLLRTAAVSTALLFCLQPSVAQDTTRDSTQDVRTIVREQIASGRSDGEIKSFLVSRYGEFVLLKPVFDWHTLLLWVTPFAALVLGGAAVWFAGSGRTQTGDAHLSADEEAELARLRRD